MSPEILDSALPCVCASVRRVSRALTQFYDEHLAPSGLLLTQYSLLSNIDRLGPIGMQALADAVAMDRTTLTRNLRPLIERRLVVVASDGDRRRRLVRLTVAGRSALGEARPYWRKAQQRFVNRVGIDRSRALTTMLAQTLEELK